MLRVIFIVIASIGIQLLMHLMVHRAAQAGFILFVAFMVAFFALRKMNHSLGSQLS